ncbi:hypothetical protein ELH67_10920 [Rhizobium ruizarguesonis]|nr:hypothetical protein [Rhizobium ruizarguesonis]TAZ95012.1 hypothetical protein ELH67_10920 [Rhizobium ruizarguesonis]
MPNRNDVGLYYLNDPVRIMETAAFKADQIRAVLDCNPLWLGEAEADDPLAGHKKATVRELVAKLRLEGPHHDKITNGESVLATIRALSIISVELQERFAKFGYELGDFDDDEDDEAA